MLVGSRTLPEYDHDTDYSPPKLQYTPRISHLANLFTKPTGIYLRRERVRPPKPSSTIAEC